MSWNVEYTDEFEEWWNGLTEDQQEDFTAVVTLLMEHGPQLPHPYSSGIKGSKHGHMRELYQSSQTLTHHSRPSDGHSSLKKRVESTIWVAGTRPR